MRNSQKKGKERRKKGENKEKVRRQERGGEGRAGEIRGVESTSVYL